MHIVNTKGWKDSLKENIQKHYLQDDIKEVQNLTNDELELTVIQLKLDLIHLTLRK